jgi:hypothetical protein
VTWERPPDALRAWCPTQKDNYTRTTVYLATVLFLAGFGGHFGYRLIRYGLATVGTIILGVAVVILATSPRPPDIALVLVLLDRLRGRLPQPVGHAVARMTIHGADA